MKLLYQNKSDEDKKLIVEVCESILSQPLKELEYSNEFAFIFVDGRASVDFDTLEIHAMFHSCRSFSQKKYPIFCFVNNIDGLLYNKELIKYDLTVIKILEINSLEDYSNFCIKELYFKLPENINNVVTIQADGFLLKSGWEDWINQNKLDWCSSHWKHYARIEAYIPELSLSRPEKLEYTWRTITKPTAIGNGGFSFRRVNIMKDISNLFSRVKLREFGRSDDRYPMEDLFFTGFMNLFDNYEIPTLKQCDEFSKDPLTRKDWDNKTYGFGYHFIKSVSEFPECNHE